MSKVTSKLQVTIPRSIARAHGICPGSEIEFESAGEVIRVRTGGQGTKRQDEIDVRSAALRWFDAATERQAIRNPEVLARLGCGDADRGWAREDLYSERLNR